MNDRTKTPSDIYDSQVVGNCPQCDSPVIEVSTGIFACALERTKECDFILSIRWSQNLMMDSRNMMASLLARNVIEFRRKPSPMRSFMSHEVTRYELINDNMIGWSVSEITEDDRFPKADRSGLKELNTAYYYRKLS